MPSQLFLGIILRFGRLTNIRFLKSYFNIQYVNSSAADIFCQGVLETGSMKPIMAYAPNHEAAIHFYIFLCLTLFPL